MRIQFVFRFFLGLGVCFVGMSAGPYAAAAPNEAQPREADIPWPPSLRVLTALARQSAGGVTLEFHEGKDPRAEYGFPLQVPDRHHYRLLTLYYFKGKEFAGIHQRFEEQNGGGRISVTLPPTPVGTDTVVLALSVYEVDRKSIEGKWYTETWNRFTTATNDGKWRFQVWNKPHSTDLEPWLTRSNVRFTRGPAGIRVCEIAGQ